MQLPFDGHFRRRLYLVRHGQAAASRPEHGLYGDAISLTETGQREARAMRDALAGVDLGAAYCSDIQRTKETAAIILERHQLSLESSERFTEMRGDLAAGLAADIPVAEKLAGFAYAMWRDDPDALFFGGDHLGDYIRRAGQTLTALARAATHSNILVVSHSGFQRAALCWAMDSVPLGLAKLEQDSCCLNILDIDVSAEGQVARKHIRLANYTPLDPVKIDSTLTDGEKLALRFSDQLKAAQPG